MTKTQSPQSDQAGAFFDRFAKTFDTFYEGKRSKFMQVIDRYFRRDMYMRFQLTFDKFGDLEGKSVLDIGCGSGVYVIEALQRVAAQAVAVDPAEGMLDILRERLRQIEMDKRCTIIHGAFPGVELAPCDHVIVMGVMDYIKDAAAFLGALRPLVRRSAAISFPSRHWFRTPLRKIRYKLRSCPVYFYDEPMIRRLCQSAGFGTVDLCKIPGAGMDYHACIGP